MIKRWFFFWFWKTSGKVDFGASKSEFDFGGMNLILYQKSKKKEKMMMRRKRKYFTFKGTHRRTIEETWGIKNYSGKKKS